MISGDSKEALFYSAETKAPFTHCISCGVEFEKIGNEFFVEKVIRNYVDQGLTDTIIDYAICPSCALNFFEEMSSESKLAISEFMRKYVPRLHVSELECLVTGEKMTACPEYQIVGHFKDGKLVEENPPYMLSHSAIEKMNSLLSASTKDEMNRFYQKHLAPDPDLFKAPDSPPVLIL